jgi:hypothetical protein
MYLDQTDPMKPRELEIGTLALAEDDSDMARCMVCRQVKPICCADVSHDGDLVNPTCDACCTHRR